MKAALCHCRCPLRPAPLLLLSLPGGPTEADQAAAAQPPGPCTSTRTSGNPGPAPTPSLVQLACLNPSATELQQLSYSVHCSAATLPTSGSCVTLHDAC
eukprot:CAMPEP_0202919198 /NCGR_PEP_ID=MMETSP1392-20130828/75261_1 /ASSEMBLY_ACC=CAM_ASM_000868 /TAXON_ID=225041 /ORGANISM="Chlamydomonas chlamydogama, Strain SAG 11-48b" /LENGTH=98 /DNA_ID=CAMNT_0049612469 /DNA_START=150 /DNA_END=443 /DNA_ORIENTATION=+